MELAAMLALVGVTAAILLGPLLLSSPHLPPRRVRSGGGNPAEVLADLEFDHATGKLSDADFASLRAAVEADAAGHRTGSEAAPEPDSGTPEAVLDALEAEILALRRQRRARRAAPAGRKTRYCPACGAALPAAARFCPDCGRAVEDRP